MTPFPQWTSRELERERLLAIQNFRKTRVEEPLGDYLDSFDKYQEQIEILLEATVDLTEWEGAALDVLTDPKQFETFRYIAAPPISEADLKVIAGVASLSKTHLKASKDDVQKLLDAVRSVLDKRRFSWLSDGEEPSEKDKFAAVIASASLMAASRAQTNRRTLSKKLQETEVMAALGGIGLRKMQARHIKTPSQGPAEGEYFGECKLGNRKADMVVRLWDDRIMPIECKVSNSALNSLKRLNNDAAVKAVGWKVAFGESQVVPVAVLGGVYDLANLLDAQERGLNLIWAHDLRALTNFVQATKGAG